MSQTILGDPIQSKSEFIFQLDLFSGIRQLGGDAVRDFLKICKEFEFKDQTILAYDGDVADSLFIVREGQLDSFAVSYTENDQIFARDRLYTPGNHFHDVWLFEPDRHPTLIRSRRAGRLIMIKSDDFLSYLKKHNQALRVIYPYLSADAQDEIHRSRFQAYLDQAGSGILPSRPKPVTAQPTPEESSEYAGPPPSEEAMGFTPNREQVRRYSRLGLLPDEFVEFDSRRSTKIMVFRAVVAAVATAILFAVTAALIVLTIGPTQMAFTIAGGVASIPLIQLLLYYINWRNAFFVITNRRLIRYELRIFQFQNDKQDIDIEKIQSVNIQKPNFIANMLQIGNAVITTASQSNVLYFDYIDSPQQVEVAINKINERNRQITTSRQRAKMREVIDRHFDIAPPMKEIKPPPPPPKPKTMWQKLRERYIKQELPGSVIYHKHPVALVRMLLWPSFLLILLVTFGYVGMFFFPEIFLLPAVIGIVIILFIADFLWFLWQIEDWRNDTFEVTDRYIFDIDRLPLGFGESRKQAELSRVENVRTIQDGFLPTLFNFGSVQVETAGVDSHIVFENVRDPNSIQNEIFAKRAAFQSKQAKGEEQRQHDQTALLIELYEEAREHQRIRRYSPLPPVASTELDDDDDAISLDDFDDSQFF